MNIYFNNENYSIPILLLLVLIQHTKHCWAAMPRWGRR